MTSTAFLFTNVRELHYHNIIISTYLLYLWLIPFAISASLTEWIADTLLIIGRYSVIKTSVWITGLFMIISTIFALVSQFTNT